VKRERQEEGVQELQELEEPGSETANGRMEALDRWGEKLGAPRMCLTAKTVPRRF